MNTVTGKPKMRKRPKGLNFMLSTLSLRLKQGKATDQISFSVKGFVLFNRV